MSEHVQSLARGLSVIRAFDVEHPRQTLTRVGGASRFGESDGTPAAPHP